MLAGAALGLINGIAAFAGATSIADDFQRRALRSNAPIETVNDVADILRASLLVNGAVTIILAIVVGLLAMGVLRGSNAARIITWILIGISICCGGCGAISAFSTAGTTDLTLNVENVSEETAQALGRALHDAIPGWLTATSGGLGCLQVLAYLAVAVLLAVPASNAYFRKPAPAWQPPEGGWPEPPQEPRTPMG